MSYKSLIYEIRFFFFFKAETAQSRTVSYVRLCGVKLPWAPLICHAKDKYLRCAVLKPPSQEIINIWLGRLALKEHRRPLLFVITALSFCLCKRYVNRAYHKSIISDCVYQLLLVCYVIFGCSKCDLKGHLRIHFNYKKDKAWEKLWFTENAH